MIEFATLTLIIRIVIYVFVLLLLLVLSIVFRKKKIFPLVFIIFTLQLAFGGVYAGYSLGMADVEADQPIYIENAELTTWDYETYDYSLQQEEILGQYGNPSGFSLMFTGDKGEERHETWYFCEDGYECYFINGILISELNDEALTGMKPYSKSYEPGYFTMDMTAGTALEMTTTKGFSYYEVHDDVVKDGAIYYGDGIVLGYADGELYYAEILLVDVNEEVAQ